MPISNIATYPYRVAPPPAAGARELLHGAINRLAALLLLVVLAPLMLGIAVWIWRRDGAPVLFAHYRVGKGGELFRCLKFRTMACDAQRRLEALLRTDSAARREWERDHKLRRDPRVTTLGRLLRRTSLDELPQLINVLRGEMNLVGPRPIVLEELRKYGPTKFHYLSVKPGMTGLWQISGRNDTTYAQRVRLDRTYVERRSFALDCLILVKTIRVVLAHDGR